MSPGLNIQIASFMFCRIDHNEISHVLSSPIYVKDALDETGKRGVLRGKVVVAPPSMLKPRKTQYWSNLVHIQ